MYLLLNTNLYFIFYFYFLIILITFNTLIVSCTIQYYYILTKLINISILHTSCNIFTILAFNISLFKLNMIFSLTITKILTLLSCNFYSKVLLITLINTECLILLFLNIFIFWLTSCSFTNMIIPYCIIILITLITNILSLCYFLIILTFFTLLHIIDKLIRINISTGLFTSNSISV